MPRSLSSLLGLTLLITFVTLVDTKAASSANDANGRYSFEKIEGGTLRMDSQTGAVALCDKKGPAWICSDLTQLQQALDQQNSLLSEISRLATHNEKQAIELKAMSEQVRKLSERLAKLENQQSEAPAAQVPAQKLKEQPEQQGPAAKAEKPEKLPEPDEESAHFEEFLDRSERLFRHFFGMVKEFKRDLADERA